MSPNAACAVSIGAARAGAHGESRDTPSSKGWIMGRTETRPEATVERITREIGVAGQYALHVTVSYPGEGSTVVTFIASTYGGPIVMSLPSGLETFIDSAVTDRIGTVLTEAWVRQFFGHGA